MAAFQTSPIPSITLKRLIETVFDKYCLENESLELICSTLLTSEKAAPGAGILAHYHVLIKSIFLQKKIRFDLNNNLAIRWAAEYGYADVVSVLLTDSRVDPAVEDNAPFRLACSNGHVEVAKLLLADKRVNHKAWCDGFLRACSQGRAEIVRLILADKRLNPAFESNRAFGIAAKNGHVEVVRLLLCDKLVDPTANKNYALRSAAREGHIEVVRLLLSDERVDPYADDCYALDYASINGHSEVVDLLSSYRRGTQNLKETNIEKITDSELLLTKPNIEFFSACCRGDVAIARRLLAEPGVNIVLRPDTFTYAFISACLQEHIDIIALLSADGRFDKDQLGEQLISAIQRGSLPVISALGGVATAVCTEVPLSLSPVVSETVLERVLVVLRAAWMKGHVEIVRALLGNEWLRNAAKGKNIFLFTTEMQEFGLEKRLALTAIAAEYS